MRILKDENIFMDLELPVRPIRKAKKMMTGSRKKRAFDLFVAGGITLVVLSWLLPIIAILIKATSNGPVFFIQIRTGQNGLKFPCLKFRTMHHERENVFKQAQMGDIRITPVGRVLRKTNLDELPQFLNVLVGHMSIVGPRPHPVELDDRYWSTLNGYKDRYAIRPGITGLAQARGSRGPTEGPNQMKHRIQYDHLYIRRQSMRLDAAICWWTLVSTLKGDKNAY